MLHYNAYQANSQDVFMYCYRMFASVVATAVK